MDRLKDVVELKVNERNDEDFRKGIEPIITDMCICKDKLIDLLHTEDWMKEQIKRIRIKVK